MTEKISIVTDEISRDLADCETFLEEHGLHAVELRCISGKRVPEVEPRDRERLLDWSRRGDPVIVAVSPGLFKCRVDDHAEIKRHLEEVLPDTLDLALELNAENLISFTLQASREGGFPKHALEALNRAAEACAEANISLLLENEPGYLGETAAGTVELIRRVGHQNLFLNWDPTNGNEFKTPALDVAAGVIAPYLRNVHVKNGILAPGEIFARCCSLKAGAIDWTAHLESLKALGYEGYFALETHYLPAREGSVEILGELRQMLAEVSYSWPEQED
ncbi:MAG: sugar phosphate isomerase/epimerase family protein [Planctomycetota bacterium]